MSVKKLVCSQYCRSQHNCVSIIHLDPEGGIWRFVVVLQGCIVLWMKTNKRALLLIFEESIFDLGIFLGNVGNPRDFLGLDFCPHSIIPVTWNPEYPPGTLIHLLDKIIITVNCLHLRIPLLKLANLRRIKKIQVLYSHDWSLLSLIKTLSIY